MYVTKKILKSAKIMSVFILVACSSYACANNNYDGHWDDNGNQITRLGNLTIKNDAILISGVADYKVTRVGKFGSGKTYKVVNVNKSPDPLGCGPRNKVTYISILPQGNLAGLKQKFILLLFYSGKKPPDIKLIKMICLFVRHIHIVDKIYGLNAES